MKVATKRYVIATKEFPIEFCCEDGYRTDYIDDACMYFNRKEADNALLTYDEPEEFQVFEVEIYYVF